MDDVRIRFENVDKTFRKALAHRSMRDLLPSLGRRLLKRGFSAGPAPTGAGEFYSLKDVSFEISAGQCVGIIGPNGAGKSTLLKCASRILRPNAGRIDMKGRVSALIEVGAGFHNDLTGRENIFLNGLILGMKRREIADRFDQIVEFSGMRPFIDTPVKRYSSGMYARLGFSVAAFMDPDVLLIDEVLSVGDISFAQKCEQKIQEILGGDTTVLFVSHNLSAVRMICDRVIVLHAGKIRFDGEPDQAIHVYHELLRQSDNEGQAHNSIRSLRLSLKDPHDQPTFTAKTGEEIVLDMELTAEQPILEAGVGFFLRNEQDAELVACTMEGSGQDPVDLLPGESLTSSFRLTANLLPGVYWIGSIVHGRTQAEAHHGRWTIDRTPNRMQLVVTGAGHSEGSVNLFPSVRSEKKPKRRADDTSAAVSIPELVAQ